MNPEPRLGEVAEPHGAEARFYEALRRPPLASFALVSVNLAVFLVLCAETGWRAWREAGAAGALDVVLRGAPPFDLVRWGARFNPGIEAGEAWRLMACTFLHIGVLHVVCNMMSLRNLGRVLENLYGRASFLGIYALAGLSGSVASCLHPKSPTGVAAGASGAVFGLLAAGIVLCLRHRAELPAPFARSVLRQLIFWGGLFLAIGFSVEMIDNSGHVGGLVGGFAAALALPARGLRPAAGVLGRATSGTALVVALGLLAWGLVGMARSAFGADRGQQAERYASAVAVGVEMVTWTDPRTGLSLPRPAGAEVVAEGRVVHFMGERLGLLVYTGDDPQDPSFFMDFIASEMESRLKTEGARDVRFFPEEPLLMAGRRATRRVLRYQRGPERLSAELYTVQPGTLPGLLLKVEYRAEDPVGPAVARRIVEGVRFPR